MLRRGSARVAFFARLCILPIRDSFHSILSGPTGGGDTLIPQIHERGFR
jgi:hypothetical protein